MYCQSSRPSDQRSTAELVSSQPLSLTITPGNPRSITKRSSSRTTSTVLLAQIPMICSSLIRQPFIVGLLFVTVSTSNLSDYQGAGH